MAESKSWVSRIDQKIYKFFVGTASGVRDLAAVFVRTIQKWICESEPEPVDEILDFERHMQDTENAMLRRENELIKRRTYVGDTPEDFEPLPDLPPPPHGYGSWLR